MLALVLQTSSQTLIHLQPLISKHVAPCWPSASKHRHGDGNSLVQKLVKRTNVSGKVQQEMKFTFSSYVAIGVS